MIHHSDGGLNVVASLWSASRLKHLLDLRDDLAVILRLKLHVFHKPFLGLFKQLTFLNACCADFKFSTVIAAGTWVGFRLMSTEGHGLCEDCIAEGTLPQLGSVWTNHNILSIFHSPF